MFAGIVAAIGRIAVLEPREGSLRIEVRDVPFADRLSDGDSVALAGVCLTVCERFADGFAVQAVDATLERTTVGRWSVGDAVNLEPALRAGDPLGGHLVQGHVDGVAEVVSVEEAGDDRAIEIRLPEAVEEVTVPQGSLTVDGVSLTVNRLTGPVARFAIIPYTWTHTTLARLARGDAVNVEGDVIGKYIRHAARPYLDTSGGGHA